MEPLVFKHWSNKKYAVMQSLHRLIRIATLSFAYILLQVQPVLSQADTTSPALHFELEEVESIGEDILDIYASDLRSIALVQRTEILLSPAPSLAQLIDLHPLIDIRTRGYHGIQSDLNIQGGSFDQSVVLLNGINVSDPQTGHFNLDLPLDHRQLDKVEILAGPATKTYGLNAYSGAVNLITSPSDSLDAEAAFSYGQFGYYNANAAVHLPYGPVNTMMTLTSSASNGYTENTDFSASGLYLHSQMQLSRLNVDLMAGWNQKDFGANAFYTPRFPEQYEETGMMFTGLKIRSFQLNPGIEANLYWKRHKDHFVLFRSNPSAYENYHLSDVVGGEISSQWSSRLGVTRSGIKIRSEQIVSTTLGTELSEPRTDRLNDSILYTYGKQRLLPGLFMNHLYQQDKFKVSGGILVQMLTQRRELKFYPGFDISYELQPGLNTVTAVNRSMRLPSFTDLFYQGPQNVGNPDLEPEYATTFESGVNYIKPGVSGRAFLFYRIGRETIDWVWEDDERWHTRNITDLNTFGGEINLVVEPGQWLTNMTLIENISVAYAYTEISKSSDEFISNYALDNLKHKFILGFNLNLPFHLHMNYHLRYYDRNGFFLDYDPGTASSIELPYASYLLNDVSLQYMNRRFTIFLDLTNIFNVEYNNRGSVIQPGRWLIGGIRIYPISAL